MTSAMDSANNPLAQGVDQTPAGLDELLALVLSYEDEQPKKRGRKKKEAPAKDFKELLWASLDPIASGKNLTWYLFRHTWITFAL